MLPAIEIRHLGVMVRVHRRAEYLHRVFDCLNRLASKRRQVTVAVMYDRPSGAVMRAVNQGFTRHPRLGRLELEAPFRLVDEQGEHFMEALIEHYAFLRQEADIDAGSLWDDDMWLDAQGRQELRRLLGALRHDRIDARSYFLWDDFDHANEAFPPHWQALVFRAYPEDEYTTEFMTHAPEHCAFSPYGTRMQSRLLNAGYLTAEGRQRTWEMFQKAGKVDGHTMCLTLPPRLVSLRQTVASS